MKFFFACLDLTGAALLAALPREVPATLQGEPCTAGDSSSSFDSVSKFSALRTRKGMAQLQA